SPTGTASGSGPTTSSASSHQPPLLPQGRREPHALELQPQHLPLLVPPDRRQAHHRLLHPDLIGGELLARLEALLEVRRRLTDLPRRAHLINPQEHHHRPIA